MLPKVFHRLNARRSGRRAPELAIGAPILFK
jgi:hypothetical protein